MIVTLVQAVAVRSEITTRDRVLYIKKRWNRRHSSCFTLEASESWYPRLAQSEKSFCVTRYDWHKPSSTGFFTSLSILRIIVL